jgi:hypothetical protein
MLRQMSDSPAAKRLPTQRSAASTLLADVLLISKRIWPRSRSSSGGRSGFWFGTKPAVWRLDRVASDVA